MSLFSKLLESAASTLKTLINVSVNYGTSVVRIVQDGFKELKSRFAMDEVERLKDQRFEELKRINSEIIELNKQLDRDGRLSESKDERLRELLKTREENRLRIDNAREFSIANDIADNGHNYATKLVLPENPNELTRIAGQSTIGKSCKRCGRQMSIRWRTGIVNPTALDLYWGCSGFFIKNELGISSCGSTEPVTEMDLKIFCKTTNEGMTLPSQRLNEMIQKPLLSQDIVTRLSDAIGEGTEEYLCPIHSEKMILLRKNNAAGGILDTYFLKCPRCEQMVKIKSATQFDALLEIYDGKGLF